MDTAPTFSAFRTVPKTGVIFVTSEASARGFSSQNTDWCNLGQGQPETGDLAGAPKRLTSVPLHLDDLEYAPTVGIWELREEIAGFYNREFRRGLPSQYNAENVCVAGGGRTLLTRAAASLGSINLGHFLPDYTAYEELLDIFKAFTAIPILLTGDNGYKFTVDDLKKEILGRGLSAILFSNPCNPTGKTVDGEELRQWIETGRKLDCSLLIDEFYSHYVYSHEPSTGYIASAARYIEDVNKDPVLLFDGFTKNWRYPGLRMTWAVGPKPVIDALASAGSFLDGGGPKPLQRAAIPLMSSDYVRQETAAIQRVFRQKRDWLRQALADLGVTFDSTPDGTFYLWGSVAQLPESLNDGIKFFRQALDHRIITVPGEFFDVNPGRRRKAGSARFKRYVRFSYGPELGQLETAVARLSQMIKG